MYLVSIFAFMSKGGFPLFLYFDFFVGKKPSAIISDFSSYGETSIVVSTIIAPLSRGFV